MALVQNVKRVLVHKQLLQRASFHISSKLKFGLPSNIEELDAQDKMGFSADRHKDMSYGIVQSQTSAMFGSSFMSDQSSQGIQTSGNQHLENYESLGAMNLNAVTQNNVPSPFLPSAEKRNSPRLNMPEGCINQQIKFTASDLQESLYPQSRQDGQQEIMIMRAD